MHENNMPSRLLPDWLCSNYCAWGTSCIAHDDTEYSVPKCLSCHKSNVEITMRAHCFYDLVYCTHF